MVSELRQRFPVTLSMAVGGLVVIILDRRASRAHRRHPARGASGIATTTVVTSTAIAIPDFWLAMVLVVLFAVKLHLLPAIGYVGITASPIQWATHLYLPWIALGLGGGATLARQLRSSLIDVLDQDYIRTAEAKGLRRRKIVLKHALKNASMVPLTLVGLQFAYLLGGTIILETIFAMPGLGLYFYDGLLAKDLPVIQGVTLVYALTFVSHQPDRRRALRIHQPEGSVGMTGASGSARRGAQKMRSLSWTRLRLSSSEVPVVVGPCTAAIRAEPRRDGRFLVHRPRRDDGQSSLHGSGRRTPSPSISNDSIRLRLQPTGWARTTSAATSSAGSSRAHGSRCRSAWA